MLSRREQKAAAIAWKIIRALWYWLRKPQQPQQPHKEQK